MKPHHLAVTAACLLGIHHHEQENSHRQHDQHRQHIGQEPVLPFNVIDHRIKPILTYQGLQFCNVRCVQLMRYTVLHLDLQISGRCFSVGLHHDFRLPASRSAMNSALVYSSVRLFNRLRPKITRSRSMINIKYELIVLPFCFNFTGLLHLCIA